MTITDDSLDRAVGAVLGSALGDALGAPYEFQPTLGETEPIAFGIGTFGHAPGEWTDDTSMAMPILEALARGERLADAATLTGIVTRWLEWKSGAKDVGIQTSRVLGRVAASGSVSETAALTASRAVHESEGRSGGNGALMRTGPIALGLLDRDPTELAADAGRMARLTHWEDDNADACALWSLAIRHAILTGELDVPRQLAHLPPERRGRWAGLIDEALAPGVHPRDFAAQNGWVVRAFQGALCAVAGSASLVDALERAIRGGNDTDTVAAIAGSLAGAVHGASGIPTALLTPLHGWPGLDAADLERLTRAAVR